MIKVAINKKNRIAKLRWLNENINTPGRYVHFINGRYRILTHVYLTSEELLVYRLMFGYETKRKPKVIE